MQPNEGLWRRKLPNFEGRKDKQVGRLSKETVVAKTLSSSALTKPESRLLIAAV